jgi:hypothetical protein
MTAYRDGWRVRCNGDNCRNVLETVEDGAGKARDIGSKIGWRAKRERTPGQRAWRLADYCPTCVAAEVPTDDVDGAAATEVEAEAEMEVP